MKSKRPRAAATAAAAVAVAADHLPPYTSGSADGSGFNITIHVQRHLEQENHDIFVAAANRLTSIIVGDLPNVSVRNKGTVTTVDDITISAELGQIDGLYGILGQAGPTSLRTGSYLPATAQMQFDIVDVAAMGASVFAQVVLHEMSHSLGFGSIWDRKALVTNGEYTGANAVAQFHALGGSGNIAVEQDGGSGTAGSHWDETTFGNELMTGYINDGPELFHRHERGLVRRPRLSAQRPLSGLRRQRLQFVRLIRRPPRPFPLGGGAPVGLAPAAFCFVPGSGRLMPLGRLVLLVGRRDFLAHQRPAVTVGHDLPVIHAVALADRLFRQVQLGRTHARR